MSQRSVIVSAQELDRLRETVKELQVERDEARTAMEILAPALQESGRKVVELRAERDALRDLASHWRTEALKGHEVLTETLERVRAIAEALQR